MMHWRPNTPPETLRRRAALLARLRDHFAGQGVLEVDTPILARAAVTDPHLHSLATRYTGPGAAHGLPLYLHTSPEFFMKRLLAAGSGSIYQIAKVFRDGEAGGRHNPEFTLLEWYRTGYDHRRLMADVEALVVSALDGALGLAPSESITYRDAFRRHAGVDPFTAAGAELAACAARHGIAAPPGLDLQDIDGWLDLLLTALVEPQLGRGRLTFLHDYPPSQAALARILPGPPPVAARFELYLEGMELANGFHELTDADEQRRRFEADLIRRRELGLTTVPMDTALLAALAHGLPDCAGVALGVDRLLMLAVGAKCIEEVLSFPLGRN